MARLPIEQAKPSGSNGSKQASTGLYVKARAGLRVRDKNVERLARRVRNLMPWIRPEQFPPVRVWAEHEYLAGQVYHALRTLGVLNGKNECRRLLDDWRKLRANQLQVANALGMTPLASVQIRAASTDAALDIALQCQLDREAEERERQNGQANVGEAEDADALDEPQDGRSLPQKAESGEMVRDPEGEQE